MRASECTTAAHTASQAFVQGLRQIPDPRQRRGQRYTWETLLLVICAALLSGQQTGAAIAQWVAEHAVEWQAWTPTTAGRVPSAATVRRALRLVDVRQLEQALGDWVAVRLGRWATGSPCGWVRNSRSMWTRRNDHCARWRWTARRSVAPRRMALRSIW